MYDVQPGIARSVNSLQKIEKPLRPTKTAAARAPITWKIVSGNEEKENMAVLARRNRPPSDTRGRPS